MESIEEVMPKKQENSMPEIIEKFFKISDDFAENKAVIDLDEFGDPIRDAALTYQEFREKVVEYSEQLSTALPNRSQAFIGISIPKGADYYACLFAILKENHVYIPLPLTESKEDLLKRAKKVEVDAVICQDADNIQWQWLRENNSEHDSLPSIGRYSLISRLKPITRNLSEFTDAKLAYIVNTSGTTGEPKSIVISHRGLYSTIQSSINLMDMQSNGPHRVLQRSELTKDPSLFELLVGLLSGACVYSFQESSDKRRALVQMPSVISKNQITMLLSPPDRLQFYRICAEEFPQLGYVPAIKTLKRLLSTTDLADPGTLKYWVNAGVRVFDGYGSTEETIGVMICELNDQYYGKIGNIRKHVFDYMRIKVLNIKVENDQVREVTQVEDGEGELCVAGPGLMVGLCERGQLKLLSNHPDLAGCRVPYEGELYYRSGDLVQIDKDGTIIYRKRLVEEKVAGNKGLSCDSISEKLQKHLDCQEEEIKVIINKERGRYEISLSKSKKLDIASIKSVMAMEGANAQQPSICYQWESAKLLVYAPSKEAVFCMGKTHLKTAIINLWADALGLKVRKIDHRVPFVCYGGNSTASLWLISSLKQKMHMEIDFAFFSDQMCLQEFIDFVVATAAWRRTAENLVGNNKKTIFYFPPLVEDTFHNFSRLKKEVGPDYHHVIFHCPLVQLKSDFPLESVDFEELLERQCRDREVQIQFMARVLANIIITTDSSRKYHLLGYSFGGLLAAATAVELLKLRYQVKYLGLVDTQPPEAQAQLHQTLRWARLQYAIEEIIRIYHPESKDKFSKYFAKLKSIPDHRESIVELLKALIADTERTLQEGNAPLRQFFTRATSFLRNNKMDEVNKLIKLKAVLQTAYYNFLSAYDYQPKNDQVRLTGVYFYRAMKNEDGRCTEVPKDKNDWEKFCHGGMIEERFNESHATILRSPAVNAIAQHLQHLDDLREFQPLVCVSYFWGRQEKLKEIHDTLTQKLPRKVANIYGFGGVGKTQIVAKYREDYKAEFRGTYCFNAETPTSLLLGYARLADEIGIVHKENAPQELIKKIKEWFSSHPGALLIFDNVEKLEDISSYLPDMTKVTTLMTSRVKLSDDYNPIPLDVFTKREALDYVIKRLKLSPDNDESILSRLVELLSNMPLALELSCAIIRQQKAHDMEYSISDFMREYNLYRSSYNAHDPMNNETGYHKTISSIWDVTRSKLFAHPGVEPLVKMIDLIAFTSPDKLSYHFCDKMYDDIINIMPQRKVPFMIKTFLSTLSDFGVIKIMPAFRGREPSYAIHRLLQDVIYDKLDSKEQFLFASQLFTLFYTAGYDQSNPYRSEVITHFDRIFDRVMNLLQCYMQEPNRFYSLPLDEIILLFTDLLELTRSGNEQYFDEKRNRDLFEKTLEFIGFNLIDEKLRLGFVNCLELLDDVKLKKIDAAMVKFFITVQDACEMSMFPLLGYIVMGDHDPGYWRTLISKNGAQFGYEMLFVWYVRCNNREALGNLMMKVDHDNYLKESNKEMMHARYVQALSTKELSITTIFGEGQVLDNKPDLDALNLNFEECSRIYIQMLAVIKKADSDASAFFGVVKQLFRGSVASAVGVGVMSSLKSKMYKTLPPELLSSELGYIFDQFSKVFLCAVVLDSLKSNSAMNVVEAGNHQERSNYLTPSSSAAVSRSGAAFFSSYSSNPTTNSGDQPAAIENSNLPTHKPKDHFAQGDLDVLQLADGLQLLRWLLDTPEAVDLMSEGLLDGLLPPSLIVSRQIVKILFTSKLVMDVLKQACDECIAAEAAAVPTAEIDIQVEIEHLLSVAAFEEALDETRLCFDNLQDLQKLVALLSELVVNGVYEQLNLEIHEDIREGQGGDKMIYYINLSSEQLACILPHRENIVTDIVVKNSNN